MQAPGTTRALASRRGSQQCPF